MNHLSTTGFALAPNQEQADEQFKQDLLGHELRTAWEQHREEREG